MYLKLLRSERSNLFKTPDPIVVSGNLGQQTNREI
jgi:hypothetical protein